MRIALLLGLLAVVASPAAEERPQPLFVYRVFTKSFRKEPGNTPERMLTDLRAMVPDDIRPWTEVSLALSASSYNYLDGDTPLEFCRRFDRLGYRFRIEIADPIAGAEQDKRRSFTPDEIREILRACAHCTGVETGETFWAFSGGENAGQDRWLLDVLRVCAEQKRTFLLGEGTWNLGHWTRFLSKHHDALKAGGLGKSLIGLHKNTKPWATMQNIGALQGAWMTDVIGDYGVWNDEWCWTYSSFSHAGRFPAYDKDQANYRKMPYTFFLRQWLWGISQGGRVSFAELPLAFDREGRTNSNFSKYLRPFIRGIGEHRILPSREAVLRKTRAIVDPFGVYPTSKGPWEYDPRRVFFTWLDEPVKFAPKSYDPFTVLFRNTYGFSPEYDGTKAAGGLFPREPSLPDRLIQETLPNTARYYAVPILADPSDQAPAGLRRLRLSTLRTNQAVKQAFDPLYPPDPSVAYATEVDDSFFVLNGNENRDLDQRFELPLGGALVSLQGELPFQNLIFGKREAPDDFWFQANGYAGDGKTAGQLYVCKAKPTIITIRSRVAPVVTPEPGMATRLTITKPWDKDTQTTTLRCDHADGAVNFTLRTK
jgi:hypothetical protein